MLRRDFTITKLERAGTSWTANVIRAGVTYVVHRRYGSWMRDHEDRPGILREIPRDWAFALQERVRKEERKGARA